MARQAREHAVMDTFGGFQMWLRANGCSENTIEDRLGVLVAFAHTHPGFPHVSPAQVTDWLGRPGYAPWTRATYFGHLRSYFHFAIGRGLLAVDPMAGMRRPHPPRGVPRPLTHAEVDTVLAAARPNTYAWLVLGLYAGLRAHEIAKLRGEDVDQDSVYVLGKGGRAEMVPTHPLVLAQSRPRRGWWFPTCSAAGHVTSLSVSTLTSRLFAANGVEGSIHRMRHTFATRLLRAGVNIRVVQTLMRHKSLASTMIYTAVDEDERRDAIGRLSDWSAIHS